MRSVNLTFSLVANPIVDLHPSGFRAGEKIDLFQVRPILLCLAMSKKAGRKEWSFCAHNPFAISSSIPFLSPALFN